MPFDKQILVFAENDAVRRTKEMVLKSIGFNVVAVGSVREFEYVASRSVFDLIILGRTVPEPRKRDAAQLTRLKQPNAPILEICNVSPVVRAEHVLRSPNPEDLAQCVKSILNADRRGEST